MNIISINKELTKKELYQMTKGSTVKRMRDAAGHVINIDAFVLYEDVDRNGEVKTILSLKDDSGDIYASNSVTFCKEFRDAYEILGDELKSIEVVADTARRSGRTYITCKIV